MNKGLLIGIGAGVTAVSGAIAGYFFVKDRRKKAWLEALENDTQNAVTTLTDYICANYKVEEQISKLKLLYNEISNETVSEKAKTEALIIVANKIHEVGGAGTCSGEPVKEEPVKEEPVAEEPVKTCWDEFKEPKLTTLPEYLNQLNDAVIDAHAHVMAEYTEHDRVILLNIIKKAEHLANDLIESSLETDESKTKEGKAIVQRLAELRSEMNDLRAKIPVLVEVVVEEPVDEETVKCERLQKEIVKLTNELVEMEKGTDEKSLSDYISKLDSMRLVLVPLIKIQRFESAKVQLESIVALRSKAEKMYFDIRAKIESVNAEPDEITEAITGLTNVLAELETHTDTKEKISSLEDYIVQIEAMLATLKPLEYVETIAEHVKTITALKVKAEGMVASLRNGRFEKVVNYVKEAKDAVAEGKPFEEVAPEMTKKIIDEYLPLTEEEVGKEEMDKVSAMQKEFLDENAPAYDNYKKKVNPVVNRNNSSISNQRNQPWNKNKGKRKRK